MGDEDALSTGVWFKRQHVGLNRIKSLMKMICDNVGLNIDDRKIVPHTGRKTMVQALDSLGETTLNIRRQSCHRSDESLRPYLSTGEKEQLQMMENLANKLTGDNNKSQQTLQEITSKSNNQIVSNDRDNGTFKSASQILKKSNKDNEISEIATDSVNSIQLTVSQDQLTKIIQSSVLSNSEFNIKLV